MSVRVNTESGVCQLMFKLKHRDVPVVGNWGNVGLVGGKIPYCCQWL